MHDCLEFTTLGTVSSVGCLGFHLSLCLIGYLAIERTYQGYVGEDRLGKRSVGRTVTVVIRFKTVRV